MDPREILSQKLQEIGIDERRAQTIALDAGSSQVLVDREYLEYDLDIYQEDLLEKADMIIHSFYSGNLEDLEDIEF